MIIFSLLALLFFCLICIPVDIEYTIGWKNKPFYKIKLILFFNQIAIDLKTKEKKMTKQKNNIKRKTFLPLHKFQAYGNIIITYLKNIIHSFYFIKGSLQIRIGLSDPADTAILLGSAYCVLYSCIDPMEKHIKINGVFDQEFFDLDGNGKIRFFPIEILSRTILFILSPTSWRNFYEIKKA